MQQLFEHSWTGVDVRGKILIRTMSARLHESWWTWHLHWPHWITLAISLSLRHPHLLSFFSPFYQLHTTRLWINYHEAIAAWPYYQPARNINPTDFMLVATLMMTPEAGFIWVRNIFTLLCEWEYCESRVYSNNSSLMEVSMYKRDVQFQWTL